MIEASGESSGPNKGALITIVGSVITIVGVILTWISAVGTLPDGTPFNVTLSGARTNYGKVALVLGIITLIFGLMSLKKPQRGISITALILAILAVGACLLEVTLGKSVNEKTFTDAQATVVVTIGAGAYISLVGSILTFISTIMLIRSKVPTAWAPPSIPETMPPPIMDVPTPPPPPEMSTPPAPPPPPPPMFEPPAN